MQHSFFNDKSNTSKSLQDIAIYGVGGFGREVLALIKDINGNNPIYNIIGYFDDGHPIGEIVNGFPVIGGSSELNIWDKNIAIAVAIGNPETKKKIIEKVSNSKVVYPTLIHPSVMIGNVDYVKIGEGCIICAGNIITTDIVIEDFVTLNLGCTVGHDTMIHKYSSFMPSVNISGEVAIGEGVYCGTGSKIINQLEVGEYATIGAGAVVVKDIPANCTAVGVPAKVIKYR